MAQINKKELKKNFKRLLEITDLCLNLKLAYLKKFYPHRKALKILFKELKEYKEARWNIKRNF